MAYRDRVRDEAIAAAKAFAHPEVEPRHLLWGLVQVLDSSTPESVPRAAARRIPRDYRISHVFRTLGRGLVAEYDPA